MLTVRELKRAAQVRLHVGVGLRIDMHCIACGANHSSLLGRPFGKLRVLGDVALTHWIVCPDTGEPLWYEQALESGDLVDATPAEVTAAEDGPKNGSAPAAE